MELFDKKYVHFMWDDNLEGKEGFFANTIEDLIKKVNLSTNKRKVLNSSLVDYPFCDQEEVSWIFFYYDPNYECEKAYYVEGKQIEFRIKDTHSSWKPAETPSWIDAYEYRIRPEKSKARLMTYRELAEWLAKGNGQYAYTNSVSVAKRISFEYDNDVDNSELTNAYKIRRWGSDEWITPTVDIYVEDCKGKHL